MAAGISGLERFLNPYTQDYLAGAGLAWEAVWGHSGPEVLSESHEALGRAAAQATLSDGAKLWDIAWSAQIQLAHWPLYERWSDGEYVTPHDISETDQRLKVVLGRIAGHGVAKPEQNKSAVAMKDYYQATVVAQALLTRRGDRDHFVLAVDPGDYHRSAAYDRRPGFQFFKVPLMLTAPDSRTYHFKPTAQDVAYYLTQRDTLLALPDPPSAEDQATKKTMGEFALRRASDLLLAESKRKLSTEEDAFLSACADYFVKRADHDAVA